MTIQQTRSWGVDKTIESSHGIFGILEDSLTVSYGSNFEKISESSEESSISFTEETRADLDDALIYTTTDYDVWEYPVYGDNSGVPIDYITVIFPKLVDDKYINKYTLSGGSCDSWYYPTHQRNNIWSYPILSDPNQLTGYSQEGELFSDKLTTYTFGGITRIVKGKWGELSTEKQSQDIQTEFTTSRMEGVGLKIPQFLSIGYKSTIEGSYKSSDLSTLTIIGEKSTEISASFGRLKNGFDTSASYDVRPYIYWAEQGYLTIDYTTQPQNQLFWAQYNRPDPAFILPWLSADCLNERDQLSREITIEPAYANIGDTVTISATIRNFSNIPTTDVDVQFYLGDPDLGGVAIGNMQTITNLARSAGPETVSIQWAATGSGEQRIYAVIDPNNDINEMHDETGAVDANNNKAYGIMQMGTAVYIDPALKQTQDYYQLQLIGNNPVPRSNLRINSYIPLSRLEETGNEVRRFELLSLPLDELNIKSEETVGTPFELVAYQEDERVNTFSFPNENSPSAIIKIQYSDEDIVGFTEESLSLYRWTGTIWELANCETNQISRLVEENMLVIPICETGIFVLSDKPPITFMFNNYLPLVVQGS